MVPMLLRALPSDIETRRYLEPFVGAGALFLALRPSAALLSDANSHLMACYEAIRLQPDLIYEYLCAHRARSSKEYYYEVRGLYNRSGVSSAQAARFIYLNKTCFNGIFRVNREGAFNVPYGHKDPPNLPTRDALRELSELLRGASLCARDFEEVLIEAGPNDFVYLDPPYPPINGTSYFTHYTTDRFSEVDQHRLADAVHSLAARGAKFMMSNADTALIRELYEPYRIVPLSVTRYITCKAVKHRAEEVVITNYPVRPTDNA